MKAILISIKPKWVAMILNGIKTKEIRKHFPRDYRGWVYIYCTKEQGLARLNNGGWKNRYMCEKDITEKWFKQMCSGYDGKGKAVARFYCDNVTEYINGGQWHDDNTFGSYDDYIKDNILEQSCLTEEELFAYCEDLAFSAINISQLEIFDRPKELSEFYKKGFNDQPMKTSKRTKWKLTKAPQSWCYVEVDE